MKGRKKSFHIYFFCENWTVSLAVMGPGQFEISIKKPKIAILSDSTGYNSVNCKDIDLKLGLNERA